VRTETLESRNRSILYEHASNFSDTIAQRATCRVGHTGLLDIGLTRDYISSSSYLLLFDATPVAAAARQCSLLTNGADDSRFVLSKWL